MKKSYLRNLAVLGITSGVILTAQQLSAANSTVNLSEQAECGCRGGYTRGPSTQKTNPDKYGSARNQNGGFVAMDDSSDEDMSGNPDEEESQGSSTSQYPSRYSPQMNSSSKTNASDAMQNSQGSNQRSSLGSNGKQPGYRYGQNTVASGDEAAPKTIEMESEDQLLKQLDTEGKRIYNSLSPEGKLLAQRLAKQYADKNQAVKHAQKQMANGMMNKEMEK